MGANYLLPFKLMKNDMVLTNSICVHAKKAGEFRLMCILTLQNKMTKIMANEKTTNNFRSF